MSDDLLFEDFSVAIESVAPRPLEGCEACRACAVWQLRSKNLSNLAEGNSR
jgi:hypothetical protein